MQQSPQMMPMMPSFPPTNITTEQIQKYLDENKKLILAILDNQNLGKLAECAQFQAQLQKNLMYLAAIADAQPQAPAIPPQMTPHTAMQQGGFYMQQHPQAAAAAATMVQQPGLYPPRGSLQFANNPHQMPDPHHHQQQMQGQMVMRPIGSGGGGPNNGMHPLHHSESGMDRGGSGGGGPSRSGGSKPDGSGADVSGAGNDGQGTSGGGHGGGGDGEETK